MSYAYVAVTLAFPKRLTHGRYVAVFKGVSERFPGDTLATASWEIRRGRAVVGQMFEDSAYGWGRPRTSLSKLVWAGKFPTGSSDSKSPDYGMCFDGGPQDSHGAALADFTKRADRLIAWRKAHS